MIIRLAAIVVVLAQTAIGQAITPIIRPTSVPRTTREWKVLRAGAKTADDFDALAKYCEMQAAQYRKREADQRAELREYYAEGNFFSPKNVPCRDQVLQSEIERLPEEGQTMEHIVGYVLSKGQRLGSGARYSLIG